MPRAANGIAGASKGGLPVADNGMKGRVKGLLVGTPPGAEHVELEGRSDSFSEQNANAQRQALQVLNLAQRTADEHVATAHRQADKICADARAMAEQIVRDAQAHADDTRHDADAILADARAHAEEIAKDAQAHADELHDQAQRRYQDVVGSLETKREALQQQIEALEHFDRDYRGRLTTFMQNQLRALWVDQPQVDTSTEDLDAEPDAD